MTINGASYNFHISGDGQISIDGHQITLTPSTDVSKHPASAGWKMFTYNGITFYILIKGGNVQLIPVVKPTGKLHLLRLT